MPFCPNCGTEVPENVNFCQKCGNALQSGQSSNQGSKSQKEFSSIVNNRVILFIIYSVLGLIGVIVTSALISRDIMYSYSPPFTDHEKTMIFMVVMSAIFLICGLIGLITTLNKKAITPKKISLKTRVGSMLSTLGFSGVIGTLVFINKDVRYTYVSPFTSHEIIMICIVVAFAIVSIIGLILLIIARNKKEN